MSFFDKYKWYILGGLGLVGLGVLTAMATSVTRLKNRKPKKILFIGDSISTGSSAYPAKMKGQRSDLDIDVLSKVGMKTSWMLDNIKNKLSSKKYDRVYIYGGVNDMFSSVSIEDALSNVQQMVNLINENGADAFVIQGYVIDGFMDLSKFSPTKYVPEVSGFIPLINRYKEYQSSLPKTIKNAHFVKPIDLGSKTSDGIHPNGTGQQIIADVILKNI